jgi:hypothetical protein
MSKIDDPITFASWEAQEVIRRVLHLEKQKIHQDKPRVTADIVLIVKEVVPEAGVEPREGVV